MVHEKWYICTNLCRFETRYDSLSDLQDANEVKRARQMAGLPAFSLNLFKTIN